MDDVLTKEKIEKRKNHVKPHDWFFKQCMAYPQVAKALVAAYLSKEDIKGMDLKTLKPEKTDFIDQRLGENACDLLFSVQKNNHKSYLYLLAEQQSSVDYSMMTRMLKYMICIYDMHKVQNPRSSKLPLILPVLIYSGNRKYTAPLSLKEASEDPERAKHHFPLAPVKMIDLQKFEDSDIRLSPDHYLEFMLFLLKNARSKDIDRKLEYIDSTIQLLKKEDRGLRFMGYGLYYIMTLFEGSDKKGQITEFFVKDTSEEERGKIMRMIDHVKEEAKLEGIEKGIEKEKATVASKLLARKMPISEISSITDLSPAEIEKLKH